MQIDENAPSPVKEALDRMQIKYSHHDKVLMFTRTYRNSRRVEVKMKFIFLLFPARMEAVVSIPVALEPEQIVSARPLLAEANEDLRLGEVCCENPANCICFSGTFEPLVEEKWCTEAREAMQEFIVEYTTDLIPCILLDVFAKATELAEHRIDGTGNNG